MKAIVFYSSTLLILAITFLGAQAIKCYICDTVSAAQKGKKCGHGDDVDADYLKDCSTDTSMSPPPNGTEWTLCRKMVIDVDFDVNENKKGSRIKRSCGWEDSKYVNDCYKRAGLGGKTFTCTCNNKDGCNGGSLLTMTPLAALLPVAALILKSYL